MGTAAGLLATVTLTAGAGEAQTSPASGWRVAAATGGFVPRSALIRPADSAMLG